MLPRLKAGAYAPASALRFSGRRAKPMAIPGLELNRMRNIPGLPLAEPSSDSLGRLNGQYNSPALCCLRR
jgi:hypothetical protein